MTASFRGNFAGNRVSNSKLAPLTLVSAVALRCCVIAIVLGTAGNLSAADESSVARPTSQRSSLFRLPGFLNRDRETNVTAKPTRPSPFLTRAAQMLVQAKSFEANGNPGAALEMARRAESIVKATGQTTGTRWPSTSQSPSQYIAELSQRIRVAERRLAYVADSPPFSDDRTFNDAPPFADDPQQLAEPSPPTQEAPGPTAARFPEEFVAQSVPLPKSARQEQTPTNVPVPVIRPQQVDSRNSELIGSNQAQTSTIKLTGATEPEQPASPPDGTDDENSLLFQQLGKMETWSAIEPLAGETSDIRNRDVEDEKLNEKKLDEPATQPSPPMVIPALIDRPNGIDDQNVAPIPTRPTDSIEGSASESVTTTIPVVPESFEQTPPMQLPQNTFSNGDHRTVIADQNEESPANIYDVTPQLLTQPNDATLAAPTSSTDNSASVWKIAAAQLVATFLGVLLAIGLFLVIRVLALQLFGTRLGVTFHFGSTSSASAKPESKKESVDTVLFGVQPPQNSTAAATSQPDETKRADAVADPTDFPFRVVGTSNSDHDSSAEGDLNQHQETAILRTVFDQNLDLMSELDKQNGSAA